MHQNYHFGDMTLLRLIKRVMNHPLYQNNKNTEGTKYEEFSNGSLGLILLPSKPLGNG